MTARSRPLHAVVVAYHSVGPLENCLDAFDERIAVTVVDNSSLPAVRAVCQANGATYLDSEANLGFAAALNLALRPLLDGEPCEILLVNPDAVIAAKDAERLAEFLHRPENARVAAVSPRLIGADGSEQRVVWPFPSPARAWLEATGLGRAPARHTFVVGAVLLLRWEALQDVGLFDERFFLYAEETDWQRRALAHGWSSVLCGAVVARHQGAGTSTDPCTRERRFHAAQELYVRKWSGRGGWLAYRAAACAGAAVRAVLLAGERRAEAARRAMLYLRGPVRSVRLAGD